MFEIIGITGTLLVLISFLLNDIKKVRIVNAIGSIIFVVYGILINSFSTALLNFVLILVHLYKLKKEE